MDWDEYPWLRPVAEELAGLKWVADLDLGPGVEAYHVSDGTDDAVLAWRDSGTSVVDLSGLVGPAVRVVGMETGTLYAENNPAAVEVLVEPVLATERGAACLPPAGYCVSLPNSSGSPALMGWSGVPSVALNNLVLEVGGAPALQFGIFYYGSQRVAIPFGNGLRCVGGQLFRLPVVQTDAQGVAQHALDLENPPQPEGEIEPGSTWNFQFWFRDPPAGGAGFDLSDGLTVPFCP